MLQDERNCKRTKTCKAHHFELDGRKWNVHSTYKPDNISELNKRNSRSWHCLKAEKKCTNEMKRECKRMKWSKQNSSPKKKMNRENWIEKNNYWRKLLPPYISPKSVVSVVLPLQFVEICFSFIQVFLYFWTELYYFAYKMQPNKKRAKTTKKNLTSWVFLKTLQLQYNNHNKWERRRSKAHTHCTWIHVKSRMNDVYALPQRSWDIFTCFMCEC